MTIVQEIILKFVKDNFVGTHCLERDHAHMLVIDREGNETMLGINLFGDILEMTPTGAYIIAKSDLPHNLDELMQRAEAVPTRWVAVGTGHIVGGSAGKDKS